MTYRLSDKADDDLLLILLESLDRFGAAQAARYRASTEHAFYLIARHPEIARLRTEVSPPVRAFPHPPHLILYDVEADGSVLVQRIRHGREDWMAE